MMGRQEAAPRSEMSAPAPGVPTVVGRSSSHFTRIVRIFAEECHFAYQLQVLRDLKSTQVQDYGGHPALRIPALVIGHRRWFGALNCCRAIERCSSSGLQVLWPEQLREPLHANAQELVLQAMADEVSLVMGGYTSGAEVPPHLHKRVISLEGSVHWLEQNIDELMAALPARDVSFLEVSLFCLMSHLSFRDVMPVASFPRLMSFAAGYGERPSCRATPYQFD